jgi:regulatory protein
MQKLKRPQMPVRDKIMEYLSARDHSERELIRKLKRREYQMDEIRIAIEQVTQAGWLKPPHELSEQIARSLSRKKKGISYINNYLRERGLPPVKPDFDNELRKALEIARQIQKNNVTLDESSQDRSSRDQLKKRRDKLARKLASRGFSMDVIHKTLKSLNDENSDENNESNETNTGKEF